MAVELTMAYTLENWQQASNALILTAWPQDAQESSTNTWFCSHVSEESSVFTKEDFEQALKKVSRRIKK